MTKPERIRAISDQRRRCLLHRWAYYVEAWPLITDAKYDEFERKLKALVKKYPQSAKKALFADICPTKNAGSSISKSYPAEIFHLCQSMRVYMDEQGMLSNERAAWVAKKAR